MATKTRPVDEPNGTERQKEIESVTAIAVRNVAGTIKKSCFFKKLPFANGQTLFASTCQSKGIKKSNKVNYLIMSRNAPEVTETSLRKIEQSSSYKKESHDKETTFEYSRNIKK